MCSERSVQFARVACLVSLYVLGCSPNPSDPDPDRNAPIVREPTGPVLCGDGESCGTDTGDMQDPTRVTTAGPGTVVFGAEDVSSSGGLRLSDKMDLLFVVDNSVSMRDKQQILAAAIPDLLERLVNPPCLNPMALDRPIQLATPEEACPTGYGRQFKPLKDIHVGIITSSLGSHGADTVIPNSGCSEVQSDLAHMMGTLERGRGNLSYQDLGFLAWDPEQRSSPPGSTGLPQIKQGFVDMLATVGEAGCGFEAPLEAMYRFLMDPAPPASLERVPCNSSDPGENCVRPQGIDATLLAQRAAFLRKDSVVAILMISDEDDCSVRDTDIGWWQMDAARGMTRASSACEADPNSACCYSCSFATPTGCPPREQDPACCPPGANGAGCQMSPLISPTEEQMRLGSNLRCYDQKRKYGYDYLYPVQRYVLGLTSPWLPEGFDEIGRPLVDDQGNVRFLKNPLYSEPLDDAGNVRSREQVFFVGIVGVPWQDVATPETRDAAGQLDLIPSDQFESSGLWERILGAKATGVLPSDPFARESTEPRSGANPITLVATTPPEGFSFNPINGKERDVFDDLQYSCIFPLPEPRSCAGAVAPTDACDCKNDRFAGNPLCVDQVGGAYGTTQYFAKAYPAPRILSVLQAVGSQAVVSSICPKDMTDTNARDFGYRPVIGTFVKEAARILIK